MAKSDIDDVVAVGARSIGRKEAGGGERPVAVGGRRPHGMAPLTSWKSVVLPLE